MTADIDLLTRLLAYRAGRASRRASHRQVSIHSQARIVCPLALAGEDTTIHIVAYGRVGQVPRILAVPDPRRRDEQFELFGTLGADLESWFEECRRSGTYPQIWVSSGAAAEHLDLLADRLRYNRVNAKVKRFGELLSYATGRAPLAGQQALLTATGVLKVHWSSGQQAAEDEHLGALLAWIDPPAGVPVLDAVAAAERVPMGVKTDPDFDRTVLEPLVRAYNDAVRAGASSSDLDARASRIRVALEPVVRGIYAATQRALTLLDRSGLPPLGDLAAMEAREASEFESFMQARDRAIPLALRDSPRAAAFGFAAREEALENVSAARVLGGRVARAAARIAGRVIVGTVENPRRTRTGAYQTVLQFEVASTQRVLHVRVRDELRGAGDPRLRVLVQRVRRSGPLTRVTLRILTGQRAVGLPSAGSTLELVDAVPSWGDIWRVRGHLKTALGRRPWTHTKGASAPPPSPAAWPRPADCLAAVEGLR